MDSILSVQNEHFSGDGKDSTKVPRAVRKGESHYTDNSLECGKSCEDLSWNHRTSTLHRSETNVIADRAVRRTKEETSAVLLQSWADSMECCCYLRNFQDLLADGKTAYDKGIGEPFKGLVIPFGSVVEYQSKLHQFGKKVLPGRLLGYVLIAGRNLEGDIMLADIEEMEYMDASEIYPRRLNAKGVLTPQRGHNFMFPIADGAAKLFGKDHGVREPTLRREQLVRKADLSGELQGNSGRSQPTETKGDAEARNDFWSIEGDFTYRHHSERRVPLCVPKEESFPIQLKYVDVTRASYTNLDVLPEK